MACARGLGIRSRWKVAGATSALFAVARSPDPCRAARPKVSLPSTTLHHSIAVNSTSSASKASEELKTSGTVGDVARQLHGRQALGGYLSIIDN